MGCHPQEEGTALSATDRCVLSYDVGEFHFAQSDYAASARYLRRAQALLPAAPAPTPFPTERLHGFLTACALIQPDAAAAAAATENHHAHRLLSCEQARGAGDLPTLLKCLMPHAQARLLPWRQLVASPSNSGFGPRLYPAARSTPADPCTPHNRSTRMLMSQHQLHHVDESTSTAPHCL
jgi:hypothetical protein